MRKNFIVWLVLPFFLAACSSGQPGIVLETDRLDFGELVNGIIVTQELSLRNEGNALLQIEAVSTSCGCTKASVADQTIQPGSSTTLRIEYDTGAHGPELIGPVTRQIFIASNDPDLPELILEIHSQILPPES